MPLLTTPVFLSDGRSVAIRPLDEYDLDGFLQFGLELPKDDWLYLEDDLQNADTIRRLINAHAAENWRQTVALSHTAQVVAYASARRLSGWSSHVADLQLVVHPGWRRCGLGSALAQAIILAAQNGLGAQKVIVDVLEELDHGRRMFEALGFAIEGRLLKHAHSRDGKLRNMLTLAYHV